jgi:hypothetical protein
MAVGSSSSLQGVAALTQSSQATAYESVSIVSVPTIVGLFILPEKLVLMHNKTNNTHFSHKNVHFGYIKNHCHNSHSLAIALFQKEISSMEGLTNWSWVSPTLVAIASVTVIIVNTLLLYNLLYQKYKQWHAKRKQKKPVKKEILSQKTQNAESEGTIDQLPMT